MNHLQVFFTSFFLLNSSLWALSDIDSKLAKIIKENHLSALQRPPQSPRALVKLGGMLFSEPLLSGAKDIACMTCHHPMMGTADGLPFPIGTGGRGMGPRRSQRSGGLSNRHSTHLLNLGYAEAEHMFWDGRVYRNSQTGELETPEPALNGKNPVLKEVAQVLTMAVSAQALFPIINDTEMRGKNNEVANAPSDVKSWEVVMERLLKKEGKSRYTAAFKAAYPNTSKFNIGHVGEAIGSFIKDQFYVADTPYDRYLNGDLSAMTDSEKRGMLAFDQKGKCFQCHSGAHLSNLDFESVGVPQFISDRVAAPYDEGRFEVTGNKNDLFKFKTPTLRNLLATAPYMHDGAFSTLEEVMDHFSDPKKSLKNFSLAQLDLANYTEKFVLDRDTSRNQQRIDQIRVPQLRNGIQLTSLEREDLLQFLKTGLLDYRFQRNRQ